MSIQQITKRAKAIRKKHPKMAWQSALKQAGRECKGKISGTKKTARKVAKKRVSGTPKKVSGVMAGVMAEYKSPIKAVKEDLHSKLGREIDFALNAKKAVDRRKHQKKAAELKGKLKKLAGF